MPSLYPPCSWRTSHGVSCHLVTRFCLLCLMPQQRWKVYIVLRNLNQWFPICNVWFTSPPDHPGLAIWIMQHTAALGALLSCVQMACIALCTMEYSAFPSKYHPLDVQVCVTTAPLSGNTNHRVNGILVLLWLEAWKFLACIAICQPSQYFCLNRQESLYIQKLHEQCKDWLLLDGFTLNVIVLYKTSWTCHRLSGLSMLVFKSSLVRFTVSGSDKFTSL